MVRVAKAKKGVAKMVAANKKKAPKKK